MYWRHLFDPSRHFRDIVRFGKYFPPNAQYLENGESDQKRVMNKKDAELNSASFYNTHFFDPIRQFRDIENFWENIFQNTQYLENGDSDQKNLMNKKDAGLNSTSFFIHNNFFIRFVVFEILTVFWKISSISWKRRLWSKKCHE